MEEGDEIIIDIPNRTLTLCVPTKKFNAGCKRSNTPEARHAGP